MKAFEKIKQDGDSPRAVFYARYSPDSQGQKESVNQQIRDITEYCQKNGITIVSTYSDKSLAGTDADRPQFKKMIEESSSGKFNLIIVQEMDCFSTNSAIAYAYRYKLKQNGVYLMSIKQPLDIDDPMSLIIESLQSSLAQLFSLEGEK